MNSLSEEESIDLNFDQNNPFIEATIDLDGMPDEELQSFLEDETTVTTNSVLSAALEEYKTTAETVEFEVNKNAHKLHDGKGKISNKLTHFMIFWRSMNKV